jgi:propanol-preferring alcohol dehydrogenase
VTQVRAMVLEKARAPLTLKQVPEPQPKQNELLVRVSACGVCRTDLQLCEGDVPAHLLPVIPGHQLVGRVVKGAGAFKQGDRVGAGWLASADGTCAACVSGRENLCEQARFTGWDVDGGYAELAVIREDFAFAMPEGFADLDAAPLLCGGVIGYRSLKRSQVRPGQRLGLYGFGASASLAIQVARHWGCRVFVATRSVHEQQRARELGAEWAGPYDARPPEPLEAAITFAPAAEVVSQALSALAPGATLAVNAIHLDGDVRFNYDTLWRERNLVSVANYTRQDARELLELAATIPIVTKRELFPLERANEALQALKQGRISGAAVLTTTETRSP